MDATVLEQFNHDAAGDLAADGIEAADGDLTGGVVDDDVDAGGLFEGANVAAFLADDAALEFFFGDRHAANRGLGGVLGGVALHGSGDDFGGFFLGAGLGFFGALGNQLALFSCQFFIQAGEELLFGFFGAESGQLLQFVLQLAVLFFKGCLAFVQALLAAIEGVFAIQLFLFAAFIGDLLLVDGLFALRQGIFAFGQFAIAPLKVFGFFFVGLF